MEDDDYELLPRDELERLRNQASSKRKSIMVEGKSDELLGSIEKLNTSINKLIHILDDAQQDIVDEYMKSKPTEKLNKIVGQNDAIARALLSINDKLSTAMDDTPAPKTQYVPQQMSNFAQSQQSFSPQQFIPPQQSFAPQQFNQQPSMSSFMQPPQTNTPPPIQNPMMQNPQQGMQNSPGNMQQSNNQFDDAMFSNLPPLDTLPPPDSLPSPDDKKKKFLGMI